MKQALKNKYYSFIKIADHDTLQLINSIFNEIDHLLLTEKGKDHQKTFLDLISVLEFMEEPLYKQLDEDIKNGVF